MEGWVGHIWEWRLLWRRHLSVWEEELKESLLADLSTAGISTTQDCWIWEGNNEEVYSFKLAYASLMLLNPLVITRQPLEVYVMGKHWKSGAQWRT